ncbi:MAG TPA: hypothetical protein VE378_00685 [Nitrososphaeraceae archaeon]|jgi:hypothetical protein|nr:hypothetical protein [Nitrososphaeraceae archaeon]
MMISNKPDKNYEIPSPLHQSLGFKDICPVWSFKLRSGFDEQDIKTLVHDSKNCIVGEAWGYTGRQAGYYVAPLIPLIGCWECVKLGRDMGKIAKESGHLAAPAQLGPTIYYFVKHWNSKHSTISEKSRYVKVRKKLKLIFQK